MPKEYRKVKIKIMCNDCLSESIVPFHVLGGKCKQCGSYNTTRTDKGDGKDLEIDKPVINGQDDDSWEDLEVS